MYLENGGTYYKGTAQHARRARFLILVQDKDAPLGPDNFRAIVRKVAMGQLGHWMMGTARIGGESITLSGTYGSDGLPCSVSRAVYERGVPVPHYLHEMWNKGGGWNSAGSEAPAMRNWANETFRE